MHLSNEDSLIIAIIIIAGIATILLQFLITKNYDNEKRD